jgi:hypothetical protein
LTEVLAVAVLLALLASNTSDPTLAVSVNVLPDLSVTFTTMLTPKLALFASDVTVHVTLPLAAPTAGVLHEPALVAALTKVLPLGTLSVNVIWSAVFGPLFVTVIV